MKIGRCLWDGHIRLVLIHEESQEVEFIRSGPEHGANPLLDLISRGGISDFSTSGMASFDDVRFLSPFSSLVRNVIAVGKNYREHALEFDNSGFNATSSAVATLPAYPQFFSKATTALTGPNDPIVFDPAHTQSVDYEGEIGVVIGRTCRSVTKAQALDHVFGFVLLNDVTARDLQKSHVQWFLGKSLDTFCPLGPWIASREEISTQSCTLKTWVNGELRQNGVLSDLIFDIPTLIETLSRTMTLLPGDIIATGTPVGVGIGFSPPRFLVDGDVVKIAATNLGEIVSRVEARGESS